MEIINNISGFLGSLGFVFMLPLAVLILALILGVKLKNALISALTVGVGFVGMGIMIGFFVKILGPAATALIKNTTIGFNAVDIGWGVVATTAFGTPVGALMMPVAFGLNLLLLKLGWTKTFNIDLWNFWHFAFTASIVYLTTGGRVLLSLIAASVHCIYTLVIADLSAKQVQDFFDLPGVSAPQGWLVTSVPVIWLLNWIVEKIPGLRDINWKPDEITKKLGFLGQPLVLGTILGLILGLFAYGLSAAAFVLALQIGALMLLIPNIVPFFKDGLTPLSDAAGQFMDNHFKDREHFLVIDYGVLVGHPNNIAAGLLLIPITLLLSFILPGNQMLPLADLAITAFFVAMIPPLTKGNLFRSVFFGTVIMIIVIYISNSLAPDLTAVANEIGVAVPQGATNFTSLAGGNWVVWVLNRIAMLFS